MELRQRKRINNLPRFDVGTDRQSIINQQNSETQKSMGTLDQKVGFGSTQSTASSLKSMVGSNAPVKSGGSPSPSFNLGPNTITSAVNGTLGLVSGYMSQQNSVKGNNALMAQSGQRTDQAFGVNYQAQNDINSQAAMDDISKSNTTSTLGMVGSGAAAGAAVGSCFPGLGTIIGGAAGALTGLIAGLFGSKSAREKQRRNIFNAQQKVNLINQIGQSQAATEGLTQQYYLDNGNTYDDVLYANRGKDLRKPRYVKRQ